MCDLRIVYKSCVGLVSVGESLLPPFEKDCYTKVSHRNKSSVLLDPHQHSLARHSTS